MTKLCRCCCWCLFDWSVCYDNFAVFNTFWGQGSPSIFMVTAFGDMGLDNTVNISQLPPHSMETASPSIMSVRSTEDVKWRTCYCWRQVGRPTNIRHTFAGQAPDVLIFSNGKQGITRNKKVKIMQRTEGDVTFTLYRLVEIPMNWGRVCVCVGVCMCGGVGVWVCVNVVLSIN